MRPFEHLPFPLPSEYDPGPSFFYTNFVNCLIEDTIKIMNEGLYIDQKAVDKLRVTVDDVLETVEATLLRNPIIQQYQKIREKDEQKKNYSKYTENVRTAEYFYKDYDEKNIQHRTFLVNTYLDSVNLSKYKQEKWTVKSLKSLVMLKNDDYLDKVLNKTIACKSDLVVKAMTNLAEYKAELWNRPRYDKANTKSLIDPFNPASSKQKQELFSMLNIEPIAVSKTTGDSSWGREQIEELKNTLNGINPDLDEVLQCFIDYSFSGIIKSNFIKAFDKFTVDGVLHGNLKLFGAKTFRYTSQRPNLLNMPSTKSKYAKALKKSFTAPEGHLVYAIDFSALEDRVLANLSGDVNKQNIFLKNLDGHSLNSLGYFRHKIIEILDLTYNDIQDTLNFKALVDNGNKIAESIRQDSKRITFGLAYGAYPPKIAAALKIPLEEAEEIFNNYHNALYPGVTDYRENYVLKTVKEKGYVHLGLGCRIYSSDPETDIRTLNNATVQFWSILTLIAINELNYRSKEAGLASDVRVCSSIYDSIYIYVKKDPETIKWLNDNLVQIMTSDYIEGQVIPNEAVGEIGNNWAEMTRIPNNASITEITDIVKTL